LEQEIQRIEGSFVARSLRMMPLVRGYLPQFPSVVLEEDPEHLPLSFVFKRVTVVDGNYRDFKSEERRIIETIQNSTGCRTLVGHEHPGE
ncbi:hypothetical protein SK128_001403, partial [Halocaridina rubra]